MDLQDGRRLTVTLGVDLDAHCGWMSIYGYDSPSYLSRGDFDAEVGAPRLLDLFAEFEVRTTWFVPGHTLLTFPGTIEAIRAAGHEIAAHGCYHERLGDLDEATERDLMRRQIEQHERVLGTAPRGYRSPSWDFTATTLTLLEESGFEWDSSLMGRDFEPYYPRHVERVDLLEGNVLGRESSIVEIPVSWYLDDFPAAEFVPGINSGLTPASQLLETWQSHFEFAYERVPNGVFNLTVHPQSIGRAHYFLMFEKFLHHLRSFDGVAFTSLSEFVEQHQRSR